jgi:transcription antitermination factor NusG
MNKKWYIVFTKEKCEKKVSSVLTKKRIKNFCPVHCKQINQRGRIKLIYEPLFPSYVFVFIHEGQIDSIKEITNVVNLVYWKDTPVIVEHDEIKEIREFVSAHQNIKLERSSIGLNTEASVEDRPPYVINGNVVTVKNRFIKINLPSLGFTMVAEVEEKGLMGRGNRSLAKFFTAMK